MGIKKRLKSLVPKSLKRAKGQKKLHFYADGLGVRNKNISHFTEPRFSRAWEFAAEGNKEGWQGNPPDIRWRASVCCWAADYAKNLEGDFVECGVHTGLLSMTVCHYLGFQDIPKQFYLYDTYAGIPWEGLEGSEQDVAVGRNDKLYFDCYSIAKRNFEKFPNAKVIRGKLPAILEKDSAKKICYLSIDLNSATFEQQTIDALWPHLVSGAIVVIDDYAFKGHEDQYQMWNQFAADKETTVLTLPTGQGLLIKPPK